MPGENAAVLEIGCGGGHALMELAWRFRHKNVQFFGLNKEAGAPLSSRDDFLQTARQFRIAPEEALTQLRLPDVFFYDATKLHFPDESLELIYSIEKIRSLPRKAEVFEEVCRVLKPGGTALLHLSGDAWNYPYGPAQGGMLLTPFEARLVLKHGEELIPLETYFKFFSQGGFSFEFINAPHCVIKITKHRPGKIDLGLVYDAALSVPMKLLPYGSEMQGVSSSGFRSVYQTRPEVYQLLAAQGWLKKAVWTQPEREGDEPQKALETTGSYRKKQRLANYRPHQRVKIKGRFSKGNFQAAKIRKEFDRHAYDELEGSLEWVNVAARTCGLLGQTLLTAEKLIVTNIAGQPVTMAKLRPGQFVQARGRFSEGKFVVEQLEMKETPTVHVDEIQGKIHTLNIGNGTLKVAGVTVFTHPQTKFVRSRR